jgi:hypothetical protein
MSGYIGSKTSVTQVDGYNRTEADAEFVQDPNGAITVSGSNVGIGTSSPSYTIESVSATSNNLLRLRSESTTPAGAVSEFRVNTGANTVDLVTGSGDSLLFSPNFTEAVRIGSSGALLVGTTSPIGAEKLGVSSTTEAAQFKNSAAGNGTVTAKNTNAGYADWIYTATTARGGGANCGFFRGIANNSINIFIYNNGNIVNANNSYGAISDVKLKENITDATPKLDKLNEVRVVNYNLTGQEQKQIGVIAQELEEIFPSMVEETVDRDEEGNDLGTTTKSVKYSVFVPMLIKAIQEQQAKIDDMETRLAALEAV